MRKTLTILTLVLAAGSIAACKPFWQKDPPATPPATVVEPNPTTVETPTGAPPEPSKPAEQTGAVEAGKTLPAGKSEVPTPATK